MSDLGKYFYAIDFVTDSVGKERPERPLYHDDVDGWIECLSWEESAVEVLAMQIYAKEEKIKKLQAENVELKRQSQWVSVDNPPTVADSGKWVAVNVLCEDGYIRVYDFNVNSKKWMHGLEKIISMPIKWMALPTHPEGE